MLSANPAHRAPRIGAAEIRQLAASINGFADAHEALRKDVERRVRDANARLEQEKNRLAALMSELAQSVIVCNVEGRVLLYNARAMQLLKKPRDGAAATGKGPSLVGLGRSIFAVFDRNLIIHALENVRERLRQGTQAPVASFVTTAPAGQLVRVQMAPVFGAEPGVDAGRFRPRRRHRFRPRAGRHHAADREWPSTRPAGADADARHARLARKRPRRGRDDRRISGHDGRRAQPFHRRHRRRSAAADGAARRDRRRVRGRTADRVAAGRHARRRPDRGGAAADRDERRAADEARDDRRDASGSRSTATR